jgi:hypothetical protein
VPGSASGSMQGVAAKPLTVAFHESGFLGKLNQESGAPFWFQLGRDGRKQLGSPFGPVNPQALNRYSYVQNNPVKYTDPSGHTLYLSHEQAEQFSQYLVALADMLTDGTDHPANDALDLATAMLDWATSALLGAIKNIVDAIVNVEALRWEKIARIRELSDRIDDMNGDLGVAIGGGANAGYDYNMWVLNRSTGDMREVEFGYLLYMGTFGGDSIFNIGAAYIGEAEDGWHFDKDADGKYHV